MSTVEAPLSKEVDFAFNREVLVVNAGLDWSHALIETAEKVGGWNQATLASAVEPEYRGEDRNNDMLPLIPATHEALGPFMLLARALVHQCAAVYRKLNKYVAFSGDTGYQVLRYKPGQHFHEHIDNIAGHSSWGQRQLSAVVYLNDDYTGGELVFPRQDMLLKPRAGDVVLFPSHFTHPHASRDVKTGVKYSVVTWFV